MLPPRTLKIMDRAIDYARARAREPHAPSPRNLTRDQRVTVELLRLQRAAHRPKRSVPADYEAPEWTAPAVRKKWIERVHSVPFDDPWRRYDRRGPQPSYTAVAL